MMFIVFFSIHDMWTCLLFLNSKSLSMYAAFPRTMSTNEGTAGLELKSRYFFWQLSKGQAISCFEKLYYIQVSS